MPKRKIPPAHRQRIAGDPSWVWTAARADLATARSYSKALQQERSAHQKVRHRLARALVEQRHQHRLQSNRELLVVVVQIILLLQSRASDWHMSRRQIKDLAWAWVAQMPSHRIAELPHSSDAALRAIDRNLRDLLQGEPVFSLHE